MAIRATKRGAQRTQFERQSHDVVICGASFAGLAVVRALRHSPARVLVLDRYEIGERQTSACAAPTDWLTRLGLAPAIKQTFERLVFHTPLATASWNLPWSWSTFDYPVLCDLLWNQRGENVEFETATVVARDGKDLTTDRGTVSASVTVDALGWRRVLSQRERIQPPEAFLSRGLEVHPGGNGKDLEIWINRKYVPAGYGWSFPASDELRIGVGSFDPRFHVRDPTVILAQDLQREPIGFQGNWIPHRLRSAVEDDVFFAGDSAGHCLPLTAEGIRPALYFGTACGREIVSVLDGRQSVNAALERYARFSDLHSRAYSWLLTAQELLPRMHPLVHAGIVRGFSHRRVVAAIFNRYRNIAGETAIALDDIGRD